MSPYLIFLGIYAPGAMSEGLGNSLSVSLSEIFIFFLAYWIGAGFAFVFALDRKVLIWLGTIVATQLFFGFNHVWGWGNHPYRFVINLIFPLGVLSSIGIYAAPAKWGRALQGWIVLMFLFACTQFDGGHRLFANIDPGTQEEQTFLAKVSDLTSAPQKKTQSDGVQHSILNSPEFNYPLGVVQNSLILNYSALPGFIPDFRYELAPERYKNRLALFCFLFPGFPHYEIQFNFRACQEKLAPPSDWFEISDPRLKGQVMALYGIDYAASFGPPFSSVLLDWEQALGWKILAQANSGKLLLTTSSPDD